MRFHARHGFFLLILMFSGFALAANPHNLTIKVLNPFGTSLETDPGWTAPSHPTYWGGDWSSDIWADNGGAGLGYTCDANVYLRTKIHKIIGGQVASQLSARVVLSGFACASGNYSQGGYAQKYEISARYGSTWYILGYVTYAHLEARYYNLYDTFDPTNALVGTVFSNGYVNNCWRSCHIHMEVENVDGWSCYNINPRLSGLPVNGTIGIMGGNGATMTHCELGEPRVQYDREYWIIDSSASLSQVQQIAAQAYSAKVTLGYSYDDAGVGDLNNRKVVIWGDEFAWSTIYNWFAAEYGGATVEQRNLPGDPYLQNGPWGTTAPTYGRGMPRVEYAREFWVVHSAASWSQYLGVINESYNGNKQTVGFSYDDAGIGQLDYRHVVVFGNEYPSSVLDPWYNDNYYGVTTSYRPNW